MINQDQSCENFVDEITQLLDTSNYLSATRIFDDKKYEKFLQNSSWELIPVFLKRVTKESRLKNHELTSCCEALLEKLAEKASPEEAILELLDQMDEADIEQFKIILNLLRIILSSEVKNRMNHLEWALNSIRSYTEKFSYEENSEELNVEDYVENFFTPEKVIEIEMTMNSILCFIENFIVEVNGEPRTEELRSLLVSRLLQIFDVFLPYINVELFPQLKAVQWKIINLLLQLLSNPMSLLEHVFYRSLNIMKSEPKNSSKSYEKLNLEKLNIEIDNLPIEPVKYTHPYEDETIVSNLAFGMFFYSLLSHSQNKQVRVPMVYNPKYIMLSLIYVTIPFFDRKNLAVSNGLKFLSLLLNQLSDSLTKSDLYFSSHKILLVHLNDVMVFSQVEENRKLALNCFKKYIESFNWEGRYLLLFNFRSHITHPGTLGFLISLLKEFLSNFLELPQNSKTHQKFLKYYKGKLLFDIIKKYCFLANGSSTDIVKNADHVISSLNAIRYLVLRDKKNVTDVKHFITKIQIDFLKPLKESITLWHDYYDFQLKELESNKSKTSFTNSGFDIELELDLKGQILPELTKDQQKTAYQSCLNAVDLIDSLWIRLTECIEETFSM